MSILSTQHEIIIGAAQDLGSIKDNSIGLVVTSPPYPMIEMWDESFSIQNPEIAKALFDKKGFETFELMHKELDKVWKELSRVMIPGGIVCINIGDATRTLNDDFTLYPNHARIVNSFQNIGLINLPNIIWRKQTNAPNKFMGSGMLPAGAYVTLEHEWILVFRKGSKRTFSTEEQKVNRRESAFFWEERNQFFSDLWELKGIKQGLNAGHNRHRTAAYPFEIPYRLILMYSLYNDWVLDPFAGTGTTALASLATGRNSLSIEIEPSFESLINDTLLKQQPIFFSNLLNKRLDNHLKFVKDRHLDPLKSEIKYFNQNLQMPVMTNQEVDLKLHYVEKVYSKGNSIFADYSLANQMGYSRKTETIKAGTQIGIDL